MMRPVSLVLPPLAPDGLTNTLVNAGGSLRRAVLTWNDNSITETSFLVQRSTNLGSTWTTITTIQSPLNAANIHQTRTYTDTSSFNPTTTVRYYRVLANNTVGYVADPAYPQTTATSVSNTRVIGPQFTITATAGAGGSISPSTLPPPIGGVTVGRGGSQTFTITPNAGYRINQVFVGGVNNTLAASTGTYTFTNVTSNKTISATFTQTQATITSSAGVGGSISPNGTRTVAIGGSQTYTVTANANYVLATVLVDGLPAALTSGTYTFTGVVANHTIVATFTATAFTITPSAGANGSITPNTVQTVTSGGSQSFTFAANAGYHVLRVLVDGVNDPAAVTSGTYSFTNVNANHTIGVAFEANPTITVTVPNGSETWMTGSTQNLGWTLSSAVSSGDFAVWLVNQSTGTWYGVGFFAAVSGATSYTPSFSTPAVPAGNYAAEVFYRADTTGFAWLSSGASAGAATITSAAPALTVNVPAGGETWITGTPQTLGWTLSPAVSVGDFAVWLVNQSTGVWYGAGFFAAIPGATTYTPIFIMPSVPTGNYRAEVFYRANTTGFAWLANGVSPGAAFIP